ncbi:hypothetical protein GDO86_014553 [Hymenochirus boettgeri]|uniref:Uncharacterized protein n=1 Tax=Hymenochirus boettgeri TaxID=247094 RepID=A0A8T2JV19_9PIPI|nr:hypothetical protein GDO86_014553 [Hymenochirus boettgeri]
MASQKTGGEKASKEAETQEHSPEHQTAEEKSPIETRASSGGKISLTPGPETHSQEKNMLVGQKIFLSSLSQQKISNQLHGTIAVLRPGFKGGHAGLAHPLNKRALTNETYSKASSADSIEESLKHGIPEEQLRILRQHLAQRRFTQHSPTAPGDGVSHVILTKTNDAEATRKIPQDDWDERAAMAELHGAMVYLREHGFRGRVTHPNQDRLHYILTQQNHGQKSPKSQGDIPTSQRRESLEERDLSLFQVISTHWKTKRHETQTKESESELRDLTCMELEKTEQVPTADKPLDLSDAKRGQLGHWSSTNKRDKRGHHEGFVKSPSFRVSPSQTMNSETEGSEENMLSASPLKDEHIGHQDEDTRDLNMDKDRDATTRRTSTRGQKRERHIEPDEEDEGDLVKDSSQADLDEMETSDSEDELESRRYPNCAYQQDGYSKDRVNRRRTWAKKSHQASSKSMERKRKLRDLPTGSDTSQE